MTLTQLLVDVGTVLEDAGGIVQYVLVFVFAAIPVIEVLVVVPIAIGLGLDPLLTGIVAFAGNVASVYALIRFHRRLSTWWRRRRGTDETTPGGRYTRARRLWDRYGLPGLSMSGPVLTGVHGRDRRLDGPAGRRFGIRLLTPGDRVIGSVPRERAGTAVTTPRVARARPRSRAGT